MPNESLNLYISIQSGSSERTLVSLTDKTRVLDKETQALKQTTEGFAKASKSLMEEQTRLQSGMKTSQKVVNELQKAYDEYGDELSRSRLDEAIEQHAKLKTKLAEVNTQINANRKSYNETIEAIRKGGLQASGGQGGTLSGKSDFAKTQLYSEILKPLIGVGGEFAETLLTSAFGDSTASVISGTLSSAISGGAAGAAFGLPGIAIGTGLGALSGLISGGTKIFEAKDDAFKDYYGGLYEDVKGRSGVMVESGSTIAGGREQTRMAFTQRLGGEEKAQAFLKRVEETAVGTNYDYDEITGYAKLLLNSYDKDEVFEVLQNLSDATAGLNLSSSDVNMMISGLSRMRTTGKATQEYLNYFRERGVDVDQALADELGVDKSGVADKVKDGEISGEDAAAAILNFIERQFGGLSDTLAGTYDAMMDNLGDVTASLEAKGGDAYNELRKDGVDAEMEALGGKLGTAIGEINAIMGENQARRENLEEQYMREALEAVLLGKEGSVFSEGESAKLAELSEQYAQLKEQYDNGDTDAGAELEALYEEAQALGQEYFENSAEVKRLNEIELDEIAAIRENTAGLTNATEASYRLSQELSKGIAAVKIKPSDVDYSTVTWTDEGGNLHYGSDAELGDGWYDDGGNFHPHAFGLERVPYDEYPALLHEGERVLTASEARAQDAGQGGCGAVQLTVTGNNFVGTGEEMAEQLWGVIVRRLEQERAALAPK